MSAVSLQDLLTFALALFVLAAPAMVFLRVYFGTLAAGDRAILGMLLGLAVHIVLLNYVVFVRLGIELAVAAVLLVAAIPLWFYRPAIQSRRQPAKERRYDRLLYVLLIAQLCLLLFPSLRNPLPFGNDAVYHVAISDKLLRTGTLPGDFLPYDPVAPTYTLGSHWLTAFVSQSTSLPVHRVYQLFLASFLVLITGLIFHLGRIVFGPRRALCGAVAFAFLANWGSLDLLRWGSLPNAAGMALFLATLRLLMSPTDRLPLLLPGVLLGALVSTHHLSALIFGLICLALAVAAVARHGWKAPFPKRVALTWALGLCVALPGVLTLVMEVTRSLMSSQRAALDAGVPYFNVFEPMIPPWEIPINLGPLLVALSALGLWNTMRDRARTPLTSDVLLWAGTLASVFVILDWPLRWLIQAIWHKELAVFTPSRFLTNLSYPLCLFAGVGLDVLWRHSRKTAGVVVAAAPVYALWIVLPLTAQQMTPGEMDGFAWLSRNSPSNSLVVQAPFWTTYLSGREGDQMVLREERLSEYTAEKRELVERGSEAVRAWMKAHNRPVYLWENRNLSAGNLERVWQNGEVYIYRFLPR